MLRHTLSAVLAAPVILSAACVADVEDTTDEPGVDELGLGHGAPADPDPVMFTHKWLQEHPSPCAEACYDAWRRICDDASVCEEGGSQPGDVVTCAGQSLSCAAVERARRWDAYAVPACVLACER
jgi:hypothetical protein